MIETTVNHETITEPTISLPPGTVVGYRKNGDPIYNIAGGSVEVTDDVDDDDEEETDETSEEVADEWVPPTKDEFDKILAAKAKADSEAAARKRFLRDNGFDPKTGKAVSKPTISLEDLDEEDEDEATAEKVVKGESKARSDKGFQRQLEREIAKTERRIRDESRVLMAAVPEALNEEGWNGKNLERMLRLLDLDSVEVDSDGEIDGLKDQVAELKKDFPEFFKRTRMREAAKEVADTATVGGGTKKAPAAQADLDWTERLKQTLYQA